MDHGMGKVAERMKAVVFRRYGPPEVLRIEEVEKPSPGKGQVRVKVRAALVGTADCELRRFKFRAWCWLPLKLMFGVFAPRKMIRTPGQELAGDIDAVGEGVENFKIGDSVVVALMGFGAYAEYICPPTYATIAPKAQNLDYGEAACLSVFALNAMHFVRKAALEPGQHLLINGAGSSIGTPAVQLAKQAGAVVTVVDRGDKLDMLRSIGADHVIDFAQEDFTKRRGIYDAILDVRGNAPYGRSLRALKPGGRLVMANPSGRNMLRAQVTNRMSKRQVKFAFAGAPLDDMLKLKALAEAGALKPVIDRSFALEDVVAAHAYVQSDAKKGNVALVMPGEG
jgi:NADPH:quinone reductase-like Zn-dependent oxidoreductase